MMKVQYGCAPINWSNDDLPEIGGDLTYQQCLSEMALAGYKGSEGGCKYPKDYDVLKKALDMRGLVICNMWFSSFFTTFRNDETFQLFDKHIDFIRSLGAKVCGVGECGVTIHGDITQPLVKNRPILTDEQFDNLCKGLNELGKRAKAKGMKICFHPHVGTGVETKAEIERLMAGTDPELVFLNFDTGHSVVAGESATDILKTFIKRVGHVHVKDVRGPVLAKVKKENLSFLQGVKEGMFTVPGDGTEVKWNEIFEILQNNNYEGWIVVEAEQDPAKADPLEYALKAKSFMDIQEKQSKK
ncbi:MAG: myo-inosose-2 dehydratase [Brevinema sp.]